MDDKSSCHLPAAATHILFIFLVYLTRGGSETLQELGTAKFQYLAKKREFQGLSHRELVEEIADFYHELNMLHPFREGNGRTQRLFFTLLIRRSGYQINFADCDMDTLMSATIYAAQGVMDHLIPQ